MFTSKPFGLVAVGIIMLQLLSPVVAQSATEEQLRNRNRTVSLGIVVFPGWEPLDVFGPLELFFSISVAHKLVLSVIAAETGLVSAGVPPHLMKPGEPPMDVGYMLQPKIEATHTFANAPALDIILIPGGLGNVALEQANDTSVEDFIALRADHAEYLLSVCTGSVSLARAGVLKGRRATTNKGAWDWVTSHGGDGINWVPTARWTQDGKVWTSSGVAAGIDMAYAFLRHFYGEDDENLVATMNGIEYAPHTNADWDPFSVVHKVYWRCTTPTCGPLTLTIHDKVPGADPDANVEGCVKPVGF
ncbi:uncharacterized protein DNG_00027 [Cephalotrichum gorgonifer]|uniref:DJ-1/PfpI domain-containing protein n=1 Tax=Cephalotrichum gorgonifer TaxID=2041049 RepID=A0AAE8MNJ5_9PEZI|nr:uncharacterized protein DNG_00027 [Cephalotrichum gorgonifer]